LHALDEDSAASIAIDPDSNLELAFQATSFYMQLDFLSSPPENNDWFSLACVCRRLLQANPFAMEVVRIREFMPLKAFW
jgi:hypothetical protein